MFARKRRFESIETTGVYTLTAEPWASPVFRNQSNFLPGKVVAE
eukprot:COSAG02_NODE_1801_length_10895_cov_4.369767_1_plen_44_part_00